MPRIIMKNPERKVDSSKGNSRIRGILQAAAAIVAEMEDIAVGEANARTIVRTDKISA